MMKTVFALVLVLAGALSFATAHAQNEASSPCLVAQNATPSPDRAGGWIGDTEESFRAIYGDPEESEHFLEYTFEGCHTVFVSFDEGHVTSITLYSPREGEDPAYLTESDEADWELAYAFGIARAFFPPDATFAEDIVIDEFGARETGFSQTLEETVPPAVYEYVSLDPTTGGFQVWYQSPDLNEGIAWITVQLRIE